MYQLNLFHIFGSKFIEDHFYLGVTRWRSWLRHCPTSRKVAGSIPDGVSLEFFIGIILPAALCPGVDSASNRNEYQEYFLESKGGRCFGLTTLQPLCADCLQIWNLPEPSEPVQACNSIALPLQIITNYAQKSPVILGGQQAA